MAPWRGAVNSGPDFDVNFGGQDGLDPALAAEDRSRAASPLHPYTSLRRWFSLMVRADPARLRCGRCLVGQPLSHLMTRSR